MRTINKKYGPPPGPLTNAQHKMHFSWFPGFHILTEKISVKVGYLKSGSSAKNLEQEVPKEKLGVNNSLFSKYFCLLAGVACVGAVAPKWNPNFVFTINVLIIRAELSVTDKYLLFPPNISLVQTQGFTC